MSRKVLFMQVASHGSGEDKKDPQLERVARKLEQGKRLNFQEGLACLGTSNLAGLGRLALEKRKEIHGTKATFIRNLHLNYTNICENRCTFCAFHRAVDAPEAFLIHPQEAEERISAAPVKPLREVHIVGGCHPGLDLNYYLELLRSLKKAAPGVALKAFTAVEVDHMAAKAGVSARDCLMQLKEAGLDVMPGGGAEVFSSRIRGLLFPRKPDAERWLQIHGEAHSLGIPTNATLLFGHLETPQERVRHLLRLREQQDRTGGFQAFIPLPFQARNTPLSHLRGPSGVEILKLLATARLILDNFPSIKAYWVMLGTRLTQVALHFGADDLEGTIVHEQIAHQAGAETARGLTVKQLRTLIQEAGFQPVERDSFHRPLGQEQPQ